jgi:RHS repeat-associated protein
LGFNGERSDLITGRYLLGNGYRAFNPVLMRLNSPDNLSPFGKGGLNPYAYCLGDPINRVDPKGHVSWLKGLHSMLDISNKKIMKLLNNFSEVQSSKKISTSDVGLSNDDVAGLPILKNSLEHWIGGEYKEFDKFQEAMGRSLVTKITESADLKKLYTNYPYKYVFSERRELIVGGSPGTKNYDYLSHPVLSQYASTPKVIGAGYITRIGQNSFTINNQTGHYGASGQTLIPVEEFIGSLGAKVEQIRLY